MSDPFSKLVDMIDKRIKQHAQNIAFWAPSLLGTITVAGLKLDCFKHVIPKYLVADWTFDGEIEGDWIVPAHDEAGQITLPAIPTQSHSPTVPGDYTATFKFSEWHYTGQIRTHKFNFHLRPELHPGDRVLVAPVNNGQDFVVISKVVPK